MTKCTICKHEFGSCDVEVHETRLLPGYRFDLDKPIETEFYNDSISPRLGGPKEKNGKTVVSVAAVVYAKK